MSTTRNEIVANGASAANSNARLLVRVAGVVGFAVLTAAGALVAIPLPGTPVPMTLQTLVVLLAGLTLGPRLGMASMAFYLLLGTTGSHVFAGGAWGFQTMLGATGGYLVGFVLAQPLLGAMITQKRADWRRLLVALVAANVVIFGCGLLWLAAWSGAGVAQTLAWGLWPFVPGLVVKTGLALGLGGLAVTRGRSWFER